MYTTVQKFAGMIVTSVKEVSSAHQSSIYLIQNIEILLPFNITLFYMNKL